MNLDGLTTIELVSIINQEDKKIALEVEKQIYIIAKAVDFIVESLEMGGRLLYIGSGTSGKLGVIDASECPPTFGVEDSLVQGILSGGKEALAGWLEYTEDDTELAIKDLLDRNLSSKDILVGISASGNTPYALSAINFAKGCGCKTIGICCRKNSDMKKICDIAIEIDVGLEVIQGSTRMKAGTAQKMVINMLSTISMIKLGKTYMDLMVSVKPINTKLKSRVKDIVKQATDAEDLIIDEVVEKCDYDAKVSIIVIKTNCTIIEARKSLEENLGNVWKTLQDF
ncbi:MAG: N-acetylmuramic acid 6-phosphate etherase [Clostridiaceae bacterium]|nr:N-acetylmuramic acid 6-phosphate etherase [Clostridiaceae bacterium]